jgi:glucokinase
MKKVIGIDLGGTNVRVATVTDTGEILEVLTSPSYANDGPEKVVANVIALIEQLKDLD